MPQLIIPGSMGTAGMVLDLFKQDKIRVGCWTEPIIVSVDEDEVKPAIDLFKEKGLSVTVLRN